MLKSKSKSKIVKPKSKHHKPIPKYTQHKQGFFPPFPHTNGLINESAPPRPLYSSGGGIPYTSTFQSFGITNKSPYFLDSLIAKGTSSSYENPVKPETSTTLTGMNTMYGNNKNQMETQTKPESVNYVNLVQPKKKGDETTQPDYVSLVPMKQKLTQKEINENRMMGNEEVGQRITEHKMKQINKPTPKSSNVEEIRKRIETRIEENKKSKIPKSSLRGKKKNEEL